MTYSKAYQLFLYIPLVCLPFGQISQRTNKYRPIKNNVILRTICQTLAQDMA